MSHLTLITSQRPCFYRQSHWGLELPHMNFGGDTSQVYYWYFIVFEATMSRERTVWQSRFQRRHGKEQKLISAYTLLSLAYSIKVSLCFTLQKMATPMYIATKGVLFFHNTAISFISKIFATQFGL